MKQKKWYIISRTDEGGRVTYYQWNYRSWNALQFVMTNDRDRARRFREKEISQANEAIGLLKNRYKNSHIKLEVH